MLATHRPTHPTTYKLIASLSPTQQSSSTASTLVTVSSHDSCISSVASESIVDLVLRQTLEWNVALSGFENALSTAEGQFMVNMIHSLSTLIIAAAEDYGTPSSSNLAVGRNVFAVKIGRHPYITLISTRVSVESILFSEMDKIIEHKQTRFSTEPEAKIYLDLRKAVLMNYIQPLLSSDPKVLVYVLIALSCFTATENLHILETGLPSQYIRERILVSSDTLVVNEYSLVIGKLVRHELQHMRRGLYKDAAFKKATPEAQTGPQELDRLQGLLRLCQAMSSINGTATTTEGGEEGDRSAETIRVRQSYRNMMTALKDVSFTDHLVERISALEGWTSLFGNMWDSSDDAQTMVVAETMIGKVYKQLADGYDYVRTESLTDVSGSHEVQFAVLESLSFITPLAAVDEKLVSSVLRGRSQRPFSEAVLRGRSEAVLRGRSQRPFSEAVLRGRSQRPFSEVVLRGFSDRLQADASSADTSIDISKWATFATRWAFCDLLAGLVDSPTRTVELNQVCQQMLHQRLTIGLSAAVALPSSSQASRTTTTEEEAAAVEKIKNITQKDLESFQQQVFSSQALARLLSAPWVLAFSDRTAASPEERKELADLLDRTLLAATSRPQLFNFTVPSCHMIHTNLEVRNPSSSEISVFTGRIHSLVSLIRITPTTAARHTAVVALASLFGVDWSRGPTVTSSGSHGLLSYLASPINPRAMASDLKAGRPAAMTLGHIACHVHRLDSGRASAEEAFVGEWGLGRILSLGGLLTAVGGDQALAELDKVRGLEGPPKRVSLPGARVVDHLERLDMMLLFNPNGSCHTDPSPSLEVLQLIFLDTLSNHMRSYGQGRVSPAVGSTSGKTKKTNQACRGRQGTLERPAVCDSTRVLPGLIPSFMTAQRVLGRLAELSLTLLLRSDAAQLGTSGCHDSPGAGARILKEAIGITSLYQAGFLTSQQEGRLTCAEESALLIAISTSQYEPEDRKMTNQPSLFYYSHGGVLNDLLYRQDESFERGVILLLKGAVLLWWDEQDIGTHGYREVKGRGRIDDQDQVSVKASSTKDGDMEASLGRKLDMISRDEIGQCDWMIVEKQKNGIRQELTLTTILESVGHGLASLTFYHCQLATRTIRTNTLRTHFKTLVELRIHPCTPVSSDTVLDVLSACPVLEVLHVRYLSAEVITERGPWTCQHRLRELTAGIQAGQDEEALQPLVFERLAALTRLKMLEILTPIPNSRRSMLGFRLECGLGQLAHWQHLSVLRFSMEWYNINTPQVGMDDVAWMGLDSSRRLNQDRDFDAAGNLPRKNFGHGGRPLGAW
ncbi:MAG: hypothetical protein J3Q66DRAFT_446228 [Benniella sp.]|nr:MAG: hypothetical protein J3Q66DRAFT_446228 [Benniella sp.]